MKLFLLFSFLVFSFAAFAQLSTNGLQFDGTNDVVTIPQNANYNLGTSDFSIEAWIRDEAAPVYNGDENIIGSWPQPSCYTCNEGFRFCIFNGQPTLHLGGPYIYANSADLRDGQCHHVAVTAHWDNYQRTIRFYVDGALVSTHYSFPNYYVFSPDPIYIGGYFYYNSTLFWAPWKGFLKEIRIWNVLRSDVQIQSNMNAVLSSSQPGLIGYWRCNEGAGTAVNDYSSIGNDGSFGSGSVSTYPVWGAGCCNSTCSPPANLSVSNITAASAKLHWSVQPCAFGYRVQYRPSGTSAWTKKNINSNVGQKNITGLSPNTTYQWRVQTKCSINPIQFSAYSSIQTFTTPLRLSEVKEEPLSVSFSPNPFSTSAVIHFSREGNFVFSLFDVFGRQVETQNFASPSASSISIERGNLSSGIYFYRVEENGKMVASGKVMIE